MKNLRNLNGQDEFIYIHFIGQKEVKIYKHYRNPVSGRLVNSGKKKLVAIIPIEKYEAQKGKKQNEYF